MQATSTQTRLDAVKVAVALLIAIVFAAGVALGAVVGTSVASVGAPAEFRVQALDPNATWFREHRAGEINAGSDRQALDPDASSLREHRAGEINAGP
jgi:hypothetical protein